MTEKHTARDGAPVAAPRARLAVFRRRPMKYSTSVTSSRRKTRKAHFTAPSSERRKIMSAPLASELKAQYGANAVPIRVNDEVRVTRGKFKDREGKVEQVYRKKWVIHIKNITRDKVNGTFRCASRSRRAATTGTRAKTMIRGKP